MRSTTVYQLLYRRQRCHQYWSTALLLVDSLPRLDLADLLFENLASSYSSYSSYQYCSGNKRHTKDHSFSPLSTGIAGGIAVFSGLCSLFFRSSELLVYLSMVQLVARVLQFCFVLRFTAAIPQINNNIALVVTSRCLGT
jgi:hypothetical protein